MMLEVKNLCFAYGKQPVLSSVSFDLAAGQCLAVLGPNGAGKSTLLKCLDGLLTPSSGTVLLRGRDCGEMSPAARARAVAYVPQQPVFPDVSVYDAVLLGRKPYIRWDASPEDHVAVERALEAMHLTALAMRRVTSLSGGEAQRVAVARALAGTPALLLLDEPTGHLDLKGQMDTVALIRDLTGVGQPPPAVMVSMHDIALALRLADTFLFLRDGQTFAHGNTNMISSELIRQVYGLNATLASVNGHVVVVAE